MSKHEETHVLDVDFEKARSVHRIVRAMHDGECPKCHGIFTADAMRDYGLPAFGGMFGPPPLGKDLCCPGCKFTITYAEQRAAFDFFAPVMEKNLAVFEEWRTLLKGGPE